MPTPPVKVRSVSTRSHSFADVLTGPLAVVVLFGVAFVLQRSGWPMFNHVVPWILLSVATFFLAGAVRSGGAPEHPVAKALSVNAVPAVVAAFWGVVGAGVGDGIAYRVTAFLDLFRVTIQ